MTTRPVLLLLLPFVLVSLGADDPPSSKPLPAGQGILPKAETGALRFLEQHPTADGRGVIVAIFDSGIDPGAAGLARTTDGKPKIIDMIDGTGSGDVDTSTVVNASGGKLAGLTGRQLTLPGNWSNPSGEYHLGWKPGYDLFPGRLVARLKRERRKAWDQAQRTLDASLRAELAEWDRKHRSPKPAEKLDRRELLTRIEQLKAAASGYDDPGPVFDCVVFHDGQAWRAAVDTDEDGDLCDEALLTNYRDEPRYGTFGPQALLNFGVNIYANGNLLSIVANGAHATHVAGIVAGHYPDSPRLNGLAPGAQLVSVKIGDTRMGSMESGAGLIRGIRAVLRNRCDLVNMSYGEPTATPDRGRLTELLAELVDRHGVIFVSSAGNAGPALSTVGGPGGTTGSLLGVGAYVSPALMTAAYSLRRGLPGMPYTWTSRGPTADGDRGIDLFAPGGAIAPVPTWMLQPNMRMNGTSMASPNACGNIALLLSALKARKTPYSPWSIRRSLKHTARPIEGPAADGFGQGPGLIQVDRALDDLLAHADDPGERLRFAVTTSGGRGRRGIYLRDRLESSRAVLRTVQVRPVFPRIAVNRDKVAFAMTIAIEVEVDWIEAGTQLTLTHGGASFQVKIDPTGLAPGAHQARIIGRDAERPERGPLFELPVTVIRACNTAAGADDTAETDGSRSNQSYRFQPGQLLRRFYAVPDGATWADVSLTLGTTATTTDGGDESPAGRRRFVLHTLELRPGRNFREDQARHYLTLRPGVEVVRSVPVTPGRTLEVCLAQYWSTLEASRLVCRVSFHGLDPDHRSITLTAGSPGRRVLVRSLVGPERLGPTASLDTHRQLLRPSSADIEPLSVERDGSTDGRQSNRLLLTYRFTQPAPGRVTPRFPDLDGMLYDSPFGTQLWMIFDGGKRRVGCDDTWPEPVRLGRGPHVLQLLLRHTDVAVLESMKQLTLALDRRLSRPIAVQISASRVDGEQGRRGFSSRMLQPGDAAVVFLGTPAASRLPSSARGGDLLLGQVHYGTENAARPGTGRRPGGFPLTLVVPAKTEKAGGSSGTSNNRPLARAERDFLVDRLKKVRFETSRKEFDELARQILKKHPNHLPVLVTRLERLDEQAHRKERLPEVVEAAKPVIEQIDTAALAAELGTNVNRDDPDAVRRRKRAESQRDTLVDALYRTGRALAYMELPDVIDKHPIADRGDHDRRFEQNFRELARWIDTTQPKYVLLHIRRERRRERYGEALKWLNKTIASSAPSYTTIKKRRDVYETLGWKHCFEQERRRLLIRFPKRYEGF